MDIAIKENAAPAVTGNGANSHKKAENFQDKDSLPEALLAIAFPIISKHWGVV